MNNGQNLANSQTPPVSTGQNVTSTPLLTPQQQAWIDYNALGGLVTDIMEERRDKDGNVSTLRKMPIYEFAEAINVSRETLRAWRNSIPDFWGKVNARRAELSGNGRLQRMHEVWYLSALKPGKEGYRDRQLWLANFDPNFRMPTEKVEVEAGNSWTALLENKRKQVDNIQEGEVIDAQET